MEGLITVIFCVSEFFKLFTVFLNFSATLDDLFGDADDISSDEDEKKEDGEKEEGDEDKPQVG